MKIGVFIKSSPASGGLEVQNHLLVAGLRAEGHEVEVVETADPRADARILEYFREEHRRQPFDVAISQSAAGTPLVKRKKELGLPVVVIQHGTLWGSLKTRWRMTPLPRRPFLLFRLIPYAIKVYFLYDLPRLKKADAVIAVSRKLKGALIREYFLSPDKITVVYNGIEIEKYQVSSIRYQARKDLGIEGGDKVILYLGRLAAEKGLISLLEAVASYQPPATSHQLVIVGDGPQREELVRRATDLGLGGRVHFVGRVSYAETPKYYQMADIFVLPSTAWEGLPMTIIEAMATGLPVVASRIGGIPEAVLDGETGSLVEPGNIGGLAAALVNLLGEDKLRLRMGQRGREVATERFSQKAMVAETLRVIGDVL